MKSVLLWYFVLQLFAFTSLPLAFRVCTRLYDRGYGLSKALGLLLVTYCTWLLCFLPGADRLWPFGFKTVAIAWAFVAVFSLVTLVRSRSAMIRSLRSSLRVIIFYEIVLVAAFCLMVGFRSVVPHISYHIPDPPAHGFSDVAAEKFTDFAVLNGLLTSTHFPPHDAWLAPTPETTREDGWLTGGWLNYYYFGHLLWAVLIKATAVRPEVGFNLALGSAFALVCVLSAALGFNLTRRIRWGLLSLFLIALSSNLDGFLQLIAIIKSRVFDVDQNVWYISGAWYRSYDFWRSSRAVQNTITEFPAFSFVLGDLHAHVSALVILLLGMGLAIQAWRNAAEYRTLFQYQLHNLDELFFMSLVAGALFAANTWDSFTFVGVFAVALWAARRPRYSGYAYEDPWLLPGRNLLSGAASLMLAVLFGAFGILALFLMFVVHFHSPLPADSPIKWLSPENRTDPFEFLSHWLMLGIAPCGLAIWLGRRIYRQASQRAAVKTEYLAPSGFWAISAGIAAAACMIRPMLSSWTPILLMTGALVLLLALVCHRQAPAIRLLLGLLLLFFVLTAFCEFFYFDDIFTESIERINTVFKIYYGLWPVLVMASIIALRRIVRYAPAGRRIGRAFLVISPLLICGAVYPLVAPIQRVSQSTRLGHWVPPKGISQDEAPNEMLMPEARARNLEEALDGMRYLKYTHADDYELMLWIRKTLPRDARILEAAGTQYTYSGRIGTMTGRTSFAGWLYHCWGWRGERFVPERNRRLQVAQEIYETTDTRHAYDLLLENGIEYVVTGDQEREQYADLAEDKFAELGTRVFRINDTAMYKIDYTNPPPETAIPEATEPSNQPALPGDGSTQQPGTEEQATTASMPGTSDQEQETTPTLEGAPETSTTGTSPPQ